jgi:terminase small subunit-like protein
MEDSSDSRALGRPSLEQDPKFLKFAELYVATGNAYRSAIAAGYDKEYARGHAWELAGRLQIKMPRALREAGVDVVQLARMLKRKLSAKTARWNPKTKQWDKLVDHGTQLSAATLALKCLDALPSLKHEGTNSGQPVKVVIESSIPRPKREAKF